MWRVRLCKLLYEQITPTQTVCNRPDRTEQFQSVESPLHRQPWGRASPGSDLPHGRGTPKCNQFPQQHSSGSWSKRRHFPRVPLMKQLRRFPSTKADPDGSNSNASILPTSRSLGCRQKQMHEQHQWDVYRRTAGIDVLAESKFGLLQAQGKNFSN